MKNQATIQLLQSAKLFSNFSEEDLTELAKKVTTTTFKKNEYLIRAEEFSEEIYIIKQGKVRVSQPNNNSEYPLAILEDGASIGELSILYSQENSVDIIALEPTKVLTIAKNDIHRFLQQDSRNKLAENINTIMLANNKSMTALLSYELEQKRQYFSMGDFIINTLLLISFYNLTLALTRNLINNAYTNIFASTGIIFTFVVVFMAMAIRQRRPMNYYGITFTNWKAVLPQSLYYTFIFIVLLTILKLVLIHTTSLFPNHQLFDLQATVRVAKLGSSTYWLWLIAGMIIYAIFVPLQEFITRGILQNSLQNFLKSRHHKLKANIVTSSMFAATHIHISPIFALIVIVPSLFWGWLYIKHKTLLSPIISHLLIGWWVIFVLGVERI